MFEEDGAGKRRQIKESQARRRAERARRAMLALLRDGPLSSAEMRSRLGGEVSLSVVNYHLSVLVSDGEVLNEGGTYRLV